MLGRLPAVSPTFLALVCGMLTGIYAFKPLVIQHVQQKYNSQTSDAVNQSHHNVKQ